MELSSQPKNNYYVYHLIDSKTGIPFYVGKGHGRRMYDHELKVKRGIVPHHNRHLFNKIKKVLNEGGTIEYVKIADELSEGVAHVTEMSEIRRIGRSNLCNLTDGGEGISGWKHSEATKSLVSSKMKRWFQDESHRQITAEATRKGMFTSGYVDRVAKEITMVSPDGKIIISKNISKFCRDNHLTNSNVYKVLRGEMKSHRGWSLPKRG